jgi:hypothetical protein
MAAFQSCNQALTFPFSFGVIFGRKGKFEVEDGKDAHLQWQKFPKLLKERPFNGFTM